MLCLWKGTTEAEVVRGCYIEFFSDMYGYDLVFHTFFFFYVQTPMTMLKITLTFFSHFTMAFFVFFFFFYLSMKDINQSDIYSIRGKHHISKK